MAVGGQVLGIDFGTSNTAAAISWPDGRRRPLLLDDGPLLSSAVLLDDGGRLITGREANHSARSRPECFEPNPKRRIDDGTVLLGDRSVPVIDLIAAVLRRVADEAQRVAPGPTRVVLTHPAAWGAQRRAVLGNAAGRAGLPPPELVPEPVAAASYFVAVQGARLPIGSIAVVYDFGAGTFDATVIRRTPAGFDVLTSEGLPDVGGLDVDAAIVSYLDGIYAARQPDLWARLEHPRTTADRRARRLLWEDARAAKETLSRSSSTLLPIPLLDTDAPLGREQLEGLARPYLDQTVAATAHAVRSAGIDPAEVTALFLVGGSSRIPLAATLLHTALGVEPTAIEQPELVVAEGSITAITPHAPPLAPRGSTPPTSRPPGSGAPISGPPTSRPPGSGIPISGAPISGAARTVGHPTSPAVRGVASVRPINSPPPATSSAAMSDPASTTPATSAAPVESGPSEWRRIGLAAAVLIVASVIGLAPPYGSEVFQFGLGAPFAFPVFLLFPAQVAAVLVSLTAERRGLWRAVRYALLYGVCYLVAMGGGFLPYEFGHAEDLGTIQKELALGGTAILGAAGLGLLIRPWSGWAARQLLPAALGLGIGLLGLAAPDGRPTQVFLYPFIRFNEAATGLMRLGGYFAAALSAVLVVALICTAFAHWLTGPTARRNTAIAAGLLLALGGAGGAVIVMSG